MLYYSYIHFEQCYTYDEITSDPTWQRVWLTRRNLGELCVFGYPKSKPRTKLNYQSPRQNRVMFSRTRAEYCHVPRMEHDRFGGIQWITTIWRKNRDEKSEKEDEEQRTQEVRSSDFIHFQHRLFRLQVWYLYSYYQTHTTVALGPSRISSPGYKPYGDSP